MPESHGDFIGGREFAPHPETAPWAAPTVCDKHERRQCEDLAMPESHGTREFIGGGELAPHPETAAQTYGWRQPFETSV